MDRIAVDAMSGGSGAGDRVYGLVVVVVCVWFYEGRREEGIVVRYLEGDD
jgi:hypothetical protein